jgi:glycosyltransferase involved in cell wall biosynthesis
MREIRAFAPDLVVAQWWHPLLGPCLRYLASECRIAGTPVLFVCHNGRPHERFPFAMLLSRRALRQANRLMALSQAVAGELGRLAPGLRVDVLEHPPNLQGTAGPHGRWRDRIGPVEGPVILFFGHVRRYKGLEDLIEAMPLVRREFPATLVVAGRFFTSVRKVRALAQRCAVPGSVRLYPEYVPGDEVSDLFSCADVVALPYRASSQSGIVAQAALFARPVVATEVGGLIEAVRDRGILVPPADPVALAEGLVRALRAPPQPPALPRANWDDWRRRLLGATAHPLRPAGVGEA